MSEVERGAAAMRDLAQLQRAPRERSIFRRKGAKGPNPLAVRKKKRQPGEAGGGGGGQAAAVQEGEAEKPRRKRARVRKKGGADGGGDAPGASS